MNVSDDEKQRSLLFNLVYCSCASAQLQSADIDHIVSVARRKNARLHISGWLVYSNGVFFQWLEGKRDEVKRLMRVIAADSRHHTVVLLSEGEEVRQRLFSGWDMELVSPQDIRTVLVDAISASSDLATTGALQHLVREMDSRDFARH